MTVELFGWLLNLAGFIWSVKQIMTANRGLQLISLIVQIVPYLGFFFNVIFFKWAIPPVQPRHLRNQSEYLKNIYPILGHIHDHLTGPVPDRENMSEDTHLK